MPDDHIQRPGGTWADVLSDSRSDIANGSGTVRDSVSGISRVTLRAEPTWNDRSAGTSDGQDEHQGSVPVRRRNPSGGRCTDGGNLRTARGRGDHDGPCFNIDVPPNGYAWWYVDGISSDGGRAVSVIGFIGSVFSPWYRWSGRKDPANHVCFNVATYGPGGRFTMTDRGRSALRRSPNCLTVGPSSMRWTGSDLVIDINETSSLPVVSRVRGRITVTPQAINDRELALTSDGTHIWRPFAPVSDITVELDAPGWQWHGHGYFDANFGTRALEDDFSRWTWGRFPTGSGATCFYDAKRLDGSMLGTGLHFTPEGHVEAIEMPPKQRFRRSLWAVARETRGDVGTQPRQVMNMLDAPFYSRSMVETTIDGETCTGVHEALDLVRFRSPFLKPMLAMRVPRRARWRFS